MTATAHHSGLALSDAGSRSSQGAAPEDLISRNRRAFAHLPPHLASIHEAHAAEERQRLITALLAKRAEFESHETKAPSRPHQKLAGDADVKEKNHR